MDHSHHNTVYIYRTFSLDPRFTTSSESLVFRGELLYVLLQILNQLFFSHYFGKTNYFKSVFIVLIHCLFQLYMDYSVNATHNQTSSDSKKGFSAYLNLLILAKLSLRLSRREFFQVLTEGLWIP